MTDYSIGQKRTKYGVKNKQVLEKRGVENVYVLKEIVKKSKREESELYQASLNMEKVYDSVDRTEMISLLQHPGVNERLIQAIKDMY